MRILLVGEFSGVHNNLKKGLEELGHDVKLAADGDGFKQLGYDFSVKPFKDKYIGRILNLIYLIINYKKFIGYDIVQFISPFVIPTYVYKLGLLKVLFENNTKIIYYACGTDPNYVSTSKTLKYHPLSNGKYYPKRRLEYYKWFIKNIDIVIPSMYDYYLGYRDINNLGNSIMLPGSGDYINQLKKPDDKLKILFGITRRDFKGADYVEDALEMILHKYGDRVEINIVERLPFDDYKLLLDKTDILIDQCKSQFYGMNAIFAMERGVIVLSGSEVDAVNYLGINDPTIINIRPNSEFIFKELEKLISLNNNEIHKFKLKSLSYVKTFHGIRNISQRFENLYCQLKSN